jgi:hypothetical protein
MISIKSGRSRSLGSSFVEICKDSPKVVARIQFIEFLLEIDTCEVFTSLSVLNADDVINIRHPQQPQYTLCAILTVDVRRYLSRVRIDVVLLGLFFLDQDVPDSLGERDIDDLTGVNVTEFPASERELLSPSVVRFDLYVGPLLYCRCDLCHRSLTSFGSVLSEGSNAIIVICFDPVLTTG